MTWFILILSVFAVYRVAHMVVSEDGPFYLFTRLRLVAHRTMDTRAQWVYEGITCVLCVSFWLAGLVTLILWLGGWLPVPGWLFWGGTAGGALFLHKFLYG